MLCSQLFVTLQPVLEKGKRKRLGVYMADQSLKRQLKVITVPVFIEIALVMLLGAVDTVMLSRYSDNSVAAVGLSYVIGIPLGYGLVGMWIGFALDENIRGVILMRRWHSGKWRTKGFVHKYYNYKEKKKL